MKLSRSRAQGPIVAVLAVLAVACSPEAEQPSAGQDRSAQTLEAATPSETSGWQASRLTDPRPSVVLIVIDTLRADAVSAHGLVVGTTPHLDAMAAKGLRYEHAYAPAPWTAASHASLFSGLRVDEHGVGLDGLNVMPESFQVLAEDFREAGYATASFAENALIDEEFGFDRGFDRFAAPDLLAGIDSSIRGDALEPFKLVERVRAWNRERDKSRPYFLFVNIFDAHDPYRVRDTNPWVPEDLPKEELEYITSKYSIPYSLCDAVPTRKHLDLLRGLYLGDVASADEKLGSILEILEEGDEGTPRIVVATSDHGEHLGENRLMGHRFSVRNVALHIPLIVTGLPDRQPGVIEQAVELRSVRASLLCWALGRACGEALPQETSSRVGGDAAESIFSIYSDSVLGMPDWVREHFKIEEEEELPSQARANCSAQDPVFGEMVSMIRFPMKITWFSNHEPVLHDLRWDQAERSDQTKNQPDLAATLRREVEAFVRRNLDGRAREDVPELSEEAARRLRQLGYIEIE